MNTLDNVWEFALKKHGDQKYGENSYSYHLKQVLEMTQKMSLTEEYQIAAILHDTLEDTETTYEELSMLFGDDVAFDVLLLTKRANETYDEYLSRLSNNKYVKAIKICDVLCNLEESVRTNKKRLVEKYEKAIFFLCMRY